MTPYYHNLAEDRAKRKDHVLAAIEENPAIDLETLSNIMSLRERVSPKKIIEYVRELEKAGLISVEMFKAYPKKTGLAKYTPTDHKDRIVER